MADLTEFRRYLSGVHPATTVDNYVVAAKLLDDYLSAHGPLSPGVLSSFAAYLGLNRDLAPRSVRLHVCGARAYLQWIKGHGTYVPDLLSPRLPKLSSRRPAAVSTGTLARFVDLAERVNEPTRTAILILPLTGLRVSECVGLPADSIDRVPGAGLCLSVIGKGDRQRLIPLSKQAERYLQQYNREYRGSVSSRWLFPTRSDSSRPISRMTVEHACTKLRRKLDHCRDREAVTPHALRRYFATTLLQRGVDLMTIKELLGHTSITTTTLYLQISGADLRRAVDVLD